MVWLVWNFHRSLQFPAIFNAHFTQSTKGLHLPDLFAYMTSQYTRFLICQGSLTCPLLSPKYRATGSPDWIRGSWWSLSLLRFKLRTNWNGSNSRTSWKPLEVNARGLCLNPNHDWVNHFPTGDGQVVWTNLFLPVFGSTNIYFMYVMSL